jgi:hypothetical protein
LFLAFALPLLQPVAGAQAAAQTAAAQTIAAPKIAAASAPTAVPALVPYSGVAVASEGKPLSGEAGVTFQIFKDESGGEPLWVESQTVAFDGSGRYQVQLGAASPNGLPADLFATGEARWLEVQIAGQAPSARVLLASVPYALKAADAATLGGLPASAYALAGAKTAASPGIAPDVASAVTTTGGTAGYLAEFSGATTIVDSPLFVLGSDVGVGTATPTATLDVSGTELVTGALTVNGGMSVTGSSTYNGPFALPAQGTATATQDFASQVIKVNTSAYNSATATAVSPRFELQAFVTGQNTANPGATLDLLASTTTAGAAPTGFSINTSGIVSWAPGQTFPATGGGTITGVTAGTGLTGGGTSGAVTLAVDNTKVPLLAGNNGFTGNQSVTGNISATGNLSVTGSVTSTGPGTFDTGGKSGTGLLGTGTATGVFGQATGTASNSFGVFGSETAATGMVFGVAGNTGSVGNGAAGVNGYESAMTGQVFGVTGSTNSTTNGATGTSGYEGAATGAVYGVSGNVISAGDGAAGVIGGANATAGLTFGVDGFTNSATNYASGVQGNANAATGVVYGVSGGSNSATTNAAGVSGYENATTGQVYGVNGSTNSTGTLSAGVNGYEGAATGQVYGVIGGTSSSSGVGVFGNDNSATGGTGVQGYVSATSGYAVGVFGSTNSPNGNGVSGVNNATAGGGFGVYGSTNSTSGIGSAIAGFAPDTSGLNFGVQGTAGVNGVGVQGTSPHVAVAGFNQVCGTSGCNPASGTAGQFATGVGGTVLSGLALTSSTAANEVFHVDSSGNGYFAGNLNVTGKVSKGSGSFKIDDPLDPANKYLSHSFVESPDMMNVYNGNITTDKRGRAVVELPAYFEALNRDFRYQLTVMGQFAQAIVDKKIGAAKIGENRFVIRTTKPSVEVSWQVTGIRKDAYANANRIPTEEEKPEGERGYYLHPEVFGQPASKGIVAARGSAAPANEVVRSGGGGSR